MSSVISTRLCMAIQMMGCYMAVHMQNVKLVEASGPPPSASPHVAVPGVETQQARRLVPPPHPPLGPPPSSAPPPSPPSYPPPGALPSAAAYPRRPSKMPSLSSIGAGALCSGAATTSSGGSNGVYAPRPPADTPIRSSGGALEHMSSATRQHQRHSSNSAAVFSLTAENGSHAGSYSGRKHGPEHSASLADSSGSTHCSSEHEDLSVRENEDVRLPSSVKRSAVPMVVSSSKTVPGAAVHAHANGPLLPVLLGSPAAAHASSVNAQQPASQHGWPHAHHPSPLLPQRTQVGWRDSGSLACSYESFPHNPGAEVCKFFVSTGFCRFGSACFKHHPDEYRVPLNQQGYPMRWDEPECTFYMQTAACKFGPACKFHHPNLEAVYAGCDLPGERDT